MNIVPRTLRATLLIPLLAAASSGCGESTTRPADPAPANVVVLNSTGQTLAAFSVGREVSAAGSPVDLGAGFDGDALDAWGSLVVTTVSAFGGSRVLFTNLDDGSIVSSAFPAPEMDLANPSAPSFDSAGVAWVGGRGSDAVYRIAPGESVAQRVSSDVGTFIEQVLPVGNRLYAVDANLDDDGGTYRPLGPGRIVVLSRSGVEERVIDLPATAFNPTDAVEAGGSLFVLAAGTLDPGSFTPMNDGVLVAVDLADGSVSAPAPLEANGVSLELGADGAIYVTTTSDFEALSVLRFDPALRSFDRGPANPIVVTGPAGEPVDCWAASALTDGRMVCVTFSFAEAGRLVLAGESGEFMDQVESGFGTTDVLVR